MKKYSISSFSKLLNKAMILSTFLHSPYSSRFLNMFCTQNLVEARFNDLHWDLIFLRLLKCSSKKFIFQRSNSFILHLTFSFFNLTFLNFGVIWTCFFFFHWSTELQLFKFSAWNKIRPKYYFVLFHFNSQWKPTLTVINITFLI